MGWDILLQEHVLVSVVSVFVNLCLHKEEEKLGKLLDLLEVLEAKEIN